MIIDGGDMDIYIDNNCPACGDPMDYCQGHGQIGDPRGFEILELHDEGDHSRCHFLSDCIDEVPPNAGSAE